MAKAFEGKESPEEEAMEEAMGGGAERMPKRGKRKSKRGGRKMKRSKSR